LIPPPRSVNQIRLVSLAAVPKPRLSAAAQFALVPGAPGARSRAGAGPASTSRARATSMLLLIPGEQLHDELAPREIPGIAHAYYDLAVRTHVAEAGPPDGPVVLALHGFPQHWYVWRRVMSLLPEVRFLAVDTRGLGWSGPASDYRKARIAEDAVAL